MFLTEFLDLLQDQTLVLLVCYVVLRSPAGKKNKNVTKQFSKTPGTETVIPNHRIFINWLHILPLGTKRRSASGGRMGDSAQGSMAWIAPGKTTTRSKTAQHITYWPLLLKTDRRSSPLNWLYMVIKCSLVCFLMVKHKTFFFWSLMQLSSCQNAFLQQNC